MFLLVLLLLFTGFSTSHCGNILIYNAHVAHSHFVFQAKLADILQEAGHNVTMLVPEFESSENSFAKKARVLIRSEPPEVSPRSQVYFDIQDDMWNIRWDPLMLRKFYHGFKNVLFGECQRLYEDTKFMDSLRNANFDFAITEDVHLCGFGLFQKLGITSYGLASPLTVSERNTHLLGLPSRKVDEHVYSDYDPNLPFSQRLYEYVAPLLYKCALFDVDHSSIMDLLVPDFKIEEVVAKVRFYFVNTDEFMEFPRPISHKVVYIGGVTIDKALGQLDESYQKIISSLRQGVVIVTFGSNVLSSQMPLDRRNALLAMFRAFPNISFIWKYEVEDDVAADLPNVYKRKWIPQKELLAHPKLLAIVSHGGMNSVLETCFAGKPMLAIPLFYDQSRNAKMLEFRKTAVIVDKHEMTAETLIGALGKLTQGSTGEAYRHRALAIAAMIAAKPLSGKERFIKYVDFAVQFKDEEDVLDMGHRKHSFIRYYNLDIIGFIVLVIVATILLFFFLIRSGLKTVCILITKNRKMKTK